MSSMMFIILMLVFVFFFMLRPKKKQEQQASSMRSNLRVGDEITTIDGIIGEVISIKEETVTIETSKAKTRIRVLRNAIATVDVHADEK